MIKAAVAALVLCWGGASVYAKAVRYGGPDEVVEAHTERTVRMFMQAEGWREVGRSNLTSNGTYAAIWFSRQGCAAPVGIAALGSGAEAGDAVRHVLGEDVAYFQAGHLTAQPHVSSFELHTLLEAALERLGVPQRPVLPVLAITPAPRSGADTCAGPAPARWERLRNGSSTSAAAGDSGVGRS